MKEGVSAVLVLSHMDLKNEYLNVILKAIRSRADEFPQLENMPVQFITGHTHYRGFTGVDAHSSSFEAGHYLDTVGFVSFDLPQGDDVEATEETVFNHQFVDANMDSLVSLSGKTSDTFHEKVGMKITKEIKRVVGKLGLGEVIACPDKEYKNNAPLESENSLYKLYMDKLIPTSVFPPASAASGNMQYHITSTGSLRYNIYKGKFYYGK